MDMREQITGALGIAPCTDPKQLPALTLAYLGDTIYDLYARTYLSFTADARVHDLHVMSNRLVCAKGQAEGRSAAGGTRTARPCRRTRTCASIASQQGWKRCSDICTVSGGTTASAS